MLVSREASATTSGSRGGPGPPVRRGAHDGSAGAAPEAVKMKPRVPWCRVLAQLTLAGIVRVLTRDLEKEGRDANLSLHFL